MVYPTNIRQISRNIPGEVVGSLTFRGETVVAIGACDVVQGSVAIIIIHAVGGIGGSAG